MTLQNAIQRLISRLSTIYEGAEAINIADLVMEKLTGWSRMERIVHKEDVLSALQLQQLEQYINELLQYRPVQYVLEEAWFAGMKLYVNENVLIPRPETEELVEWISESERILDIGTGSGCIPIALKKKFPNAALFACDISGTALAIADRNAQTNGTCIERIQCDVLDKNNWQKLPQVDVIVSNPPYIPEQDKTTMHRNVLNYEPSIALFVPDKDPLVFYRTIAELASFLSAKTIYLEIHEEQGEAVVQLLKDKGFTTIELKKDMQGKDRMVKAVY